jgi:hypothetical protein
MGNAPSLMQVLLILVCLLPVMLRGQLNETSSVGGRLTVYGGSSALRVAMVQDAEILIKDLDHLAGEVTGKAFPIFLQLYPAVEGKASRIGRDFLKTPEAVSKYRLQIDLRLGQGNSFDQDQLDRVLLEMLLMERTLRSLPEDETAERVEIRPWLLDGVMEAILWDKNKGDRRMYSSLVDSGGWVEVEKLADRTTVGDLDVLTRELFRASSGALVMALLAQPQGKESMVNFLGKVAVYEGEPLNLLRTHFPQVNLGSKSLERWWMLQVAAMSEQKLTERMTIPETEEQLGKVLELHLRDARGRVYRVGIESWNQVAALATKEERIEAVRPALDLLAHLSFRSFPTYRDVIGEYIRLLSGLAMGKTEGMETALGNLQTFRTAESQRHEQVEDYMDWHHLRSVIKESGKFEDFIRLKKNLRGDEDSSKDPIQEYLDKVQKLYEQPKRR